jgi:predicted RNA binding protein YcfA (HicA-like mRNA interferase family)
MNHPNHEFIVVLPLHSQISKGVLNQIIKDLGLTVEDFLKLI